MKILITSGPTVEPIDDVRVITNISTGKTGSVIANELSRKHHITYIHSEYVRYLPRKNRMIEFKKFSSFKSLNLLLKNELGKKRYDLIIHLSAVSDYTPIMIKIKKKSYKIPLNFKLNSEYPSISIVLKRNFKIVNRIKRYSKNREIKVIAFKLTSNATEEEIIKKINSIKADMIVHNDISQITDRFHRFSIYFKNRIISKAKDEKELAKKISRIIEKWEAK